MKIAFLKWQIPVLKWEGLALSYGMFERKGLWQLHPTEFEDYLTKIRLILTTGFHTWNPSSIPSQMFMKGHWNTWAGVQGRMCVYPASWKKHSFMNIGTRLEPADVWVDSCPVQTRKSIATTTQDEWSWLPSWCTPLLCTFQCPFTGVRIGQWFLDEVLSTKNDSSLPKEILLELWITLTLAGTELGSWTSSYWMQWLFPWNV